MTKKRAQRSLVAGQRRVDRRRCRPGLRRPLAMASSSGRAVARRRPRRRIDCWPRRRLAAPCEHAGERRIGAHDPARPVDRRDRHRRVVEEAHEAHLGGALRIGASSPRARLSTSVRDAPGAPSAPNGHACGYSRTGRRLAVARHADRGRTTSVLTSPGTAAIAVSSAAPSPDTMSASFSPPEPNSARSWPSQSASVALR